MKKRRIGRLYAAFCVPTVFLAMWIEYQNCPRGLLPAEVPLVFLPAALLGFLCGRAGERRVFLRGWALNILSSLAGMAAVSLAGLSCPRNDAPFWDHFSPAGTALGMLLFVSGLALYLSWLFFLMGGSQESS